MATTASCHNHRALPEAPLQQTTPLCPGTRTCSIMTGLVVAGLFHPFLFNVTFLLHGDIFAERLREDRIVDHQQVPGRRLTLRSS